MPTLPELQASFARAIWREDAREVVTAVLGDGLTPAARLQVYWNHVFSSLTEALESTFPVVCRLVDRRFFGFAADRYIRSHPPTGPCLFEYGAAFPNFLGSFPPCADYPYLADVARLEWAMNVALHADEAIAIPPAALGDVDAEDIDRLVFRLVPSAAWLGSRWPVDRIWRANQPDADGVVDLAVGATHLEVRRHEDVVTMRRLEPVEHTFRSGLADGDTLEAVAARAMAQDSSFDLAATLRALLAEGLITGFTVAPHPARAPEATEEGGSR